MTIEPLGDAALVVSFAENSNADLLSLVSAWTMQLIETQVPGVVDVVPAYVSVTVFYDPLRVVGLKAGDSPYAIMKQQVAAVTVQLPTAPGETEREGEKTSGRCMEISVSYGSDAGMDLAEVAAYTGLTEVEVMARHCGVEYRVQAIGFAPGFPYLSGLPAELATPRRATPRAKVPAGSVGIGGVQTGVYPIETPGGWQIIGRTDLKLFDATRAESSWLRVGDRVRFRAVAAQPCALKMTSNERVDDFTPEPEVEQHNGDETSRALRVLQAGMWTTVQDLGRVGQRAAGVPLSGAMDLFAARVANLLVGNAENAAVLELTLLGPEIEFLSDGWIALTGAQFSGCASWRPLMVRAAQRIKFGAATKGCRGYLALAGGIEVAPVLGSRSTYGRAGLGGWQGRALQAGDVLPMGAAFREVADRWSIDSRIIPNYGSAAIVRVALGAQAGEFADTWLKNEFRVTPLSDRMGMRLAGTALERTKDVDLLSSAVAPGTVQVPPNGQPIVLLADAQTIGGYPQLAHVIGVDLPLLAQLRPGDSVRFQVISIEEAQERWLAREQMLAKLRAGLAQKIR
ncbi:MAG: 5-oxoprolinase subunit PxpB [Opitutaceae bacterium]